jgi:hypothetical protein
MSLTPEQLAELTLQLTRAQVEMSRQQVYAAWFSGVAAFIQAIGAVATILLTVKLAKDAVAREAAAEAAALAREQKAEEASRLRAEAAELREEERHRQEELADFNRPIEVVLGIGQACQQKMAEQLRQDRAHFEVNPAYTLAQYAPQKDLLAAVSNARGSTTDATVAAALARVEALANGFNSGTMAGLQAVELREAHHTRIAEALEELACLRRH